MPSPWLCSAVENPTEVTRQLPAGATDPPALRMTGQWPSPRSLPPPGQPDFVIQISLSLSKTKCSGLQSWKAVKQILHFMSEDNPSAFSEVSLQAHGEQREPCDKWGHGASSRQSVWHAVNPPALAGQQVWREKARSILSWPHKGSFTADCC